MTIQKEVIVILMYIYSIIKLSENSDETLPYLTHCFCRAFFLNKLIYYYSFINL
jgi:hypothetical protein